MTEREAIEKAMEIISISMPSGWVMLMDRKGNEKVSPKAIALRDRIARELVKAFWTDPNPKRQENQERKTLET